MNKYLKIIVIALAVMIIGTGISIPVIAAASEDTAVSTEAVNEEETAIVSSSEEQTKSTKAWAAAIVVGVAAAVGAIGMALAIAKSAEGTSRQPEAGGKIQTMLMLGLVFIETAIIYALIVAILIIFVL